jgi:hypothetical protein
LYRNYGSYDGFYPGLFSYGTANGSASSSRTMRLVVVKGTGL